MEMIRAFLKKWSFKETPKKTADGSTAFHREGPWAKLWRWILPILLGATAGWFCTVCLEIELARYNQTHLSPPPVLFTSIQIEPKDTSSFLKINPFKITPMPSAAPSIAPPPPAAPEATLAAARLLWPVAGIGAWLEEQGKLRIVLINESFGDYRLEMVDNHGAIFSKNKEYFTKDLIYSKMETYPPRMPMAQNIVLPRLKAPQPEIQEVIDRETIGQLLENPMEAMKRTRFRPAPRGEGLQVQWLGGENILTQLGLRQYDVIRSINGIPLRSMTDISRFIDSLMNSDRIDIEIMRGGTSALLQRVVR